MAEVIRMNGAPVQVNGLYKRAVPQEDGPALLEAELVVILRGSLAHRSFVEMLKPGLLVVELPDGPAFQATVATATHASSGMGEAAAYRHDVVLRETPASAQRRADVAAAEAAQRPAEPPPAVAEEDETDTEPDAPANLSDVTVSAPAESWATALRQLTHPGAPKPAAPQSPLAPAELAGAEAVLVGLRLEALIETLDRNQTIRRSAVDDAFLRLIEERFVTEATPVVGDQVAQRIVKDLLGGA